MYMSIAHTNYYQNVINEVCNIISSSGKLKKKLKIKVKASVIDAIYIPFWCVCAFRMQKKKFKPNGYKCVEGVCSVECV